MLGRNIASGSMAIVRFFSAKDLADTVGAASRGNVSATLESATGVAISEGGTYGAERLERKLFPGSVFAKAGKTLTRTVTGPATVIFTPIDYILSSAQGEDVNPMRFENQWSDLGANLRGMLP